jgi:ELWxxDGT repeat protein
MVTQFSPANALTDYGSGVAFQNDLYFTATVGQTTGLYKSDGTATGTVLVKALSGGSPAVNRQFTPVNNTLFFVWNNDLWESDGTAAGTAFVKDFGGAQGQSPNGLTNFNGTLYFTAPDLANPANSPALWKTDGTAAGTVEVNLAPNNLANPINGVFNLTASGGKLFFQTSGTAVWESDGTAAGTALLPKLPGSASDVAVGNGVVYYAYGYQAPGGEQFDVGAINGGRAAPLADFVAQAVTDFTFLNNRLFFLAQNRDSSWELSEAGGPNGPVSAIAGYGAGYDPIHGNLPDLTAFNGAVYFAGSDATHGIELWKTDGTAAGTVRLADINPGATGSEPPLGDGSGASSYQLTVSGGKLFFTADDGSHGDELWETDGTAAGTVLVGDVNPGPQGSDPQNLIDVNGTLFFTANDGGHGEQLWAAAAAPLSATGQPIMTVQGQTFSGQVATFSDPNPLAPGSYTATITWGDGHTSAGTVAALANGQFAVSGGNDYTQPGAYTVSVQIGRPGGGATATTTATVSTVASGQVFETTAGQPFSGVVATFFDSGPAAATADAASITWGDGHVWAGTITAKGKGLFAVSGTNTYATGPASYPVVVNISLTGGAKGIASSAALVSSSASGPAMKAAEGHAFSGVVATFTDPGPTAASADTATITWGDGQTSAGTLTALGGGRFAVSGSNSYHHAGSYTISVQINPAAGGSMWAASAVTVADEPFWATRTFQHVAQGQPVTGVLGTLADLNPLASAGDFTVTVSWGDGSQSAGTLQPAGQGTFNITGSHVYATAGAEALTVSVTDEGGRTATANPLIAVDPAPAVVLSAAGQTIAAQEGQPFSGVVATFSDPTPQAAGAYAAAITWGNGATSAGTVAALANGQFSVSGSNTYSHAGTYAVKVQVSRPGGVSAAAATTANVSDAPFWATRTFQRVGVGQPVAGVLGTLVDQSPSASAGDFTVVIDWGDGTKSLGLVLPNGNGTFDIAGSHDYASAGARVLDVTITDEGGRSVMTDPLITVDSW